MADDLPDAPWITAAPAAAPKAAELPDAPWATPQAAPAAPAAKPPAPPQPSSLYAGVGEAMPEAYQDPERGVGASLVKAAKAAPHSAVEFGRNMIQPVLHPVDTAAGIKNLGLGVLQKSGIVAGSDHEKYADAVGKFFVDRYGSLDAARKTFEQDPVGMAGDLSMLLTGGGGLAARAPGIAGRVGEVAGAVGRVIDPMTPALTAANATARGVGRLGTEFAGVTTGAGGQSLRLAGESGFEGGHAGQVFRDNMRGHAPLEAAVNEARGAVAQLRQERGNLYRQDMASLHGDTTVLDFNGIDRAVAGAEGIKNYRGMSGTGPAQSLSPRTAAIRQEMGDAIEHWRTLDPAEFHTPEGFDALKQQLGDIRDGTQPHTPDRVAADRIYHAVRQSIIDQAPEYARTMQGYEQASNQIREIERTLSLNPNASIDTALRKLQSSLRDNVNTSFGRRTELVDMLTHAGAPHLMERLAGQTLRSWTPRGLARLVAGLDVPAAGAAAFAGHPAAAIGAAAALPTMSPRLMGEVAHGVGRAARVINPVLSAASRPARLTGEIERQPFSSGPNPYAP